MRPALPLIASTWPTPSSHGAQSLDTTLTATRNQGSRHLSRTEHKNSARFFSGQSPRTTYVKFERYRTDQTVCRMPFLAQHDSPERFIDRLANVVHRTMGRVTLTVCLALLLGGCATEAIDLAPAAADQPWQDPQRTNGANLTRVFTVASLPDITEPASSVMPDPKRTYGLVELIDLAQQSNPKTRMAWNHAREAALAVGMVEATFLPVISANAVGGYQRTSLQSPLVIGPRQFDTNLSGIVPALALGWLIVDFGQRQALLEASRQLSRAANILFNAEHQRVIWSVTTRFYEYNLVRERVTIVQEAQTNRERILQAARARQKAGIGTTVETALAEQAVMQARLQVVTSEAATRNAYLNLLAAVGLSPMTQVKIAAPSRQKSVNALQRNLKLTEQAIREALSIRPDIAASYAAMKAAQASIKAVEADFLPKVYLGGILTTSNTSFNLQGLPALSQQANSSGILIGITLPLYDGGLRNARLMGAQIRSDQASQNFEQLQRDAVREIVLAETVLRSSQESDVTARELVRTARIAYDSALDAYRAGLATITMVTEAANGLLDARRALLDAQVASEVATANLAFAMGEMTSSNAAVSAQAGKPLGTLSRPASPVSLTSTRN